MIALLAPLVIQAAVPVFAPPLDVPITYRISEVRQDGARTQRFLIDRRATFRRDADGFTATVETLAVTGDAGRAGALFATITRSMLDVRVVVHFDDAGKVIDVDNLDRIWDAQLAAISRTLIAARPGRAADVAALIAPLHALSRPAKVARVGEMAACLIADRTLVPRASHAITLTARGQDGSAAPLTGTERVVVGPDRRLLLERDARGVVSGTPISTSVRTTIDPQTGLIASTVSTDSFEAAPTRLTVTRSTVVGP